MAIPNSTSFQLTQYELIRATFHLLNITDIDQNPENAEYVFAEKMLNMLIKHWQVSSKLWKRRQGVLILQKDQNIYEVASNGDDHVTDEIVLTTIGSTETFGQTTLTLSSTSGMAINDHIGIELDDNTRQWTTITSIIDDTTVVISNALTDQATIGKTVISYTNKIARPLGIIQARTFDLNNEQEIEIKLIPHDEYFAIPLKSSGILPTKLFYQEGYPLGLIYVWGTPNTVDHVIKFSYMAQISDATGSADNFDFPPEWQLALTYNLAVLIGEPYVSQEKFAKLEMKAAKFLAEIELSTCDDTRIQLMPNIEGYIR